MIEDLTKEKLEQYGFDKESIKRLFTWENYECALTSNRGYFWASNKEKKIYSGIEGKEKHFSRSIFPEHHNQPKEKFETFEDLFQYATLVGSIERPKTNYLYSAKRSRHNFTFNLWLQDYKGWEYGNGEMYIEFLTRECWVEYLKYLEEEDSKLKQKAAHLKANWQPQQQNKSATNSDCKNEKNCNRHFITEITDLCTNCSIREKVKSVRDNMINKYEFLAKNNTEDFLIDYLKNNIITANNKIENIFNKENTSGNLHRSGRVSILLSYKDCLKYYNEQLKVLNGEKIQTPDDGEFNTMFNLLGLYRDSQLQPTNIESEMINPPNISTALTYHIPQVLQKHNLTPLIAAELLDRLKSVHKESIIQNIVLPITAYLRNNESVLKSKPPLQKETVQQTNSLPNHTIADFRNFIYGCNGILKNAQNDIIKWQPDLVKENWEKNSFLANGQMKTAQKIWKETGSKIFQDAHLSKAKIEHLIFIEQNTLLIQHIKNELGKISNTLTKFRDNNNMLHCDIAPKNHWFKDLWYLVVSYKNWFDELIAPIEKPLPPQQTEIEQLGNDLIKSTIEDYLQPFEKKINPSSYKNLIEYLKEYFDAGKFPLNMVEIKINKIPKKAFGWALTEIFRACKTNNEPLTYEYLEFGKNNISIFKNADLTNTNMNKSTLYKYYTTKTVVK